MRFFIALLCLLISFANLKPVIVKRQEFVEPAEIQPEAQPESEEESFAPTSTFDVYAVTETPEPNDLSNVRYITILVKETPSMPETDDQAETVIEPTATPTPEPTFDAWATPTDGEVFPTETVPTNEYETEEDGSDDNEESEVATSTPSPIETISPTETPFPSNDNDEDAENEGESSDDNDGDSDTPDNEKDDETKDEEDSDENEESLIGNTDNTDAAAMTNGNEDLQANNPTRPNADSSTNSDSAKKGNMTVYIWAAAGFLVVGAVGLFFVVGRPRRVIRNVARFRHNPLYSEVRPGDMEMSEGRWVQR